MSPPILDMQDGANPSSCGRREDLAREPQRHQEDSEGALWRPTRSLAFLLALALLATLMPLTTGPAGAASDPNSGDPLVLEFPPWKTWDSYVFPGQSGGDCAVVSDEHIVVDASASAAHIAFTYEHGEPIGGHSSCDSHGYSELGNQLVDDPWSEINPYFVLDGAPIEVVVSYTVVEARATTTHGSAEYVFEMLTGLSGVVPGGDATHARVVGPRESCAAGADESCAPTSALSPGSHTFTEQYQFECPPTEELVDGGCYLASARISPEVLVSSLTDAVGDVSFAVEELHVVFTIEGAPVAGPSPDEPTVAVSPEAGPAGTLFTVDATGFTPSDSVTTHLAGPHNVDPVTEIVNADATGAFTDEVDSTGLEPGIWRYWAIDDATGAMSNVHGIPISAIDAPFMRVDLETDTSPRMLEAFHPFYIEHGWVLADCEDGQPEDFDSDLIFDDGLRIDLYLNEIPRDPELRARCFELDDGSEVFAKNHRYWFPEGLPPGTHELRGGWWWHEDPDEPVKLETLTLEVQTTEDPPEAPPSGVSLGVLHLGDSLNPLTSFEPGLRVLGQAVWPAALNLATPTGEPEPGVVTEIPTEDNGGVTVNADGTATIRYEIDGAAVWEDGTPISADDFVFTHEVICTQADPVTVWPRLQLCPGARADGIEVVDGPTVLGPKSVEVTLDQPTLEYVLLFSLVLPRQDVEGTDVLDDWDDQMWMSGGPFRFADWEPGEWVELERNPNYWRVDPETGETLPHLDRVVFRSYDTAEAVTDAFAQRQVDVAPLLRGPFDEVVALRDDGADVQVADHSSVVEVLYFNFDAGRFDRNPGSLNEHLQFRRAVAHAIDRDAIAQEFFGGEVPGTHSVTAPNASHISDEPWDRYPHDFEAAGDVLTQLEAELEADFETSPPIIDVIMLETATVRMELAAEDGLLSNDLADVGIELTAEGLSALAWIERVFSGDEQAWDTTIFGWAGGAGTVGAASLLSVFSPSGPSQIGSWGDGDVGGDAAETYGQLLEQLQTTIDFDEAAELIRQAEAILADQMVVLPLFAHPDLGGVWPDRVAGFEAISGLSLWQIELWREVDVVSKTVDGGGTVTTDPAGEGATEDDPVQVAVTTPNAGTVTIARGPTTQSDPQGFELLGLQVDIDAPDATVDDPLQIVFTLHNSQIPDGEDQTTLQVFKNGTLVGECTGEPGHAHPDPCITTRQHLEGGDVQLTVLTSSASAWNFGTALDGPEETCVDLHADQTLPVGEVCVDEHDDQLTVTYKTYDGWTLAETHLVASADEPGSGQWTHDDLRWQTRQGNPRPGQFPYGQEHDPAVDTTAIFTIPHAGPGGVLHLAAHAEVFHLNDDRTEGAWAEGTRFVESGSWATWFTHTPHNETEP